VLKSHTGALIGASLNNQLLSQSAQTGVDLVGQAGSSGAPAPTAPAPTSASSYPGPKNLQITRIPGKRDIQLTWQDMGPDFHYNVYASLANDPPAFDRDGYLLRQPNGVWTPPKKGPQVFLIYVTAVNPQGQESAPSERRMVDLR